MTSQRSIADLIGALEGASDALQSAKSHRQRVQRNDRLIAAGLALHGRLMELQEWLEAYFEAKGDDEKYLSFLHKYEDGYRALDAVEHAIDRWYADHFIEEMEDALISGLRLGTAPGPKATDISPRFTRKEIESQAKRGAVAVGGTGGRQAHSDREGTARGAGEAVQQSLLA